MPNIKYYIVDVFTDVKYRGNPLGVFIDQSDQLSSEEMLSIARELNFSEVTFIKKQLDDLKFDVRIFTPEYEVPFAGHPSLGTAYIISSYLLPEPPKQIILKLKHLDLKVDLSSTDNLDSALFTMQQAPPNFHSQFSPESVAKNLGLDLKDIDVSMPIEEVSTGLPYIIIHMRDLEAIDKLKLKEKEVYEFLVSNKLYKTNHKNGLTTSFFFVTRDTVDKEHDYNSRMFCFENGKVVEDPATGSANGSFLAYLLKHGKNTSNLIVEQGYQMGRASKLYLNGALKGSKYHIEVGGQVTYISEGVWSV